VILLACGARTELGGKLVCGAPVTRDVQVPVTTPWSDTGIDVLVGTDVVIHASGTVRYGPMSPQTTDANGGNFDGTSYFPSAVYPKAIVCSLIGRVGDTPVPKQSGFVGVDYHETMTSGGRLFLGFNDQQGQFGDNSGAFDVTITTTDACR
jgi:hypothetical protein